MRRVLVIAAVLVAMATGCTDAPDHNGQDVSFAKNMVPHHQQAVIMSDMAAGQSNNPQVQDLAGRIKSSQTAEISVMNGWLSTWGEQPTDHSGHGSEGTVAMDGMQGMLSEADMGALARASGPEFDRLFATSMTAHHQGALEMAKVQLEKGKYEPANALARDITTSQQQEIAEMAQLQGGPAAP